MFESGPLERQGRRQWSWRGVLPGTEDSLRSAADDALAVMRARTVVNAPGEVVARIPGLMPMPFGLGDAEEMGIRFAARAEGGTQIEVSSRSVNGALLTDNGRNAANIRRLLALLGVEEGR